MKTKNFSRIRPVQALEIDEPLEMTTVTIELGDFTLAALGVRNGDGDDTRIPSQVTKAISYYLADRDRGRPEWRFPAALPDDVVGPGIRLEARIDDSLWRSFTEEAARQRVTPQQLIVHAALYYSADRDAGRLKAD